jgi:hypothetical protein
MASNGDDVSRLSLAAAPDQAGEHRPRHVRWPVQCLIMLGYLLAAVVVTSHLWADPAVRVPNSGQGNADIILNAWYLRYAATCVSHVRLPALVTTALNWPQGVNAMWNTSMLLPAVLLTPVTLLAGPVVSLALLLTLGFAGSAAAMFWVLRRWGASIGAAAIGGALYGFSPALIMTARDHYHLQFAVLPPLIIDAVLRLAAGRGRPVRTGVYLGLLVAAQIFVAEEVLVDTALAGLIVLLVLAASRPSEVPNRLYSALPGFAVAAGVILLACGRALWVQFLGPLADHGSPWKVARFGNQPADFVKAPDGMLFHGSGIGHYLASISTSPPEYLAYLGWPLLAVLLAASIFCWRDLKVRIPAVTFFLLSLLSIGSHAVHLGWWRLPAGALPWHWLLHVPVLNQALANRISIVADGAAAAVLAFAIDRAMAAVPDQRRRLRPLVPMAALVALVPLLPLAVPAVSLSPAPAGLTPVLDALHLPAQTPVLILPPLGYRTMQWQATTGADFTIVSGFCIAPTSSGGAGECGTRAINSTWQQTTALRLNRLARGEPGSFGPSHATMYIAMRQWRPGAIVAAASANSALGHYLISFFGPPTVRRDEMLGWRLGKNWHPRPAPLPRRQRSLAFATAIRPRVDNEDGHRFMLAIGPAERYLQPGADGQPGRISVGQLRPPPRALVELGDHQHRARLTIVLGRLPLRDGPANQGGAARSRHPAQVRGRARRALSGRRLAEMTGRAAPEQQLAGRSAIEKRSCSRITDNRPDAHLAPASLASTKVEWWSSTPPLPETSSTSCASAWRWPPWPRAWMTASDSGVMPHM